ncbi:hypothetical protein Tco_0393534 [Tanacetum coccineum]
MDCNFRKLTRMELHISIIPYLKRRKTQGSFTLPCFINNVCFDNALADLGASVSVMPLSTYLNLGLGELAHTKLTVELANRTVKYPKGIAENVLVGNEVRLMGETLVVNRSLDPLYGDYIELNDLNVPLELRRDQVDNLMPTIEEGGVVEEFRARNDAIMKDMDCFSDEDFMGDVIFGEPFLREVGVKARRFDGMITIYNGNESVSKEEKKNEISHPYQKLKGFYKGVLNLGPEYIRDEKTEEWLTRGHISGHKMEW